LNGPLLLAATIPILLVIPHNAFAWGGPWSWGERGFHHWGPSYGGCGQLGPGSWDNGYNAGIEHASYDHDNNLVYSPYPETCQTDVYNHAFHEGHDKQWNTYQSQTSEQGSSINVINSPGAYVSTNQYSNQQQNPLQQLGHLVCNVVNCSPGYQGGYGP
jgi:hypothetical protein